MASRADSFASNISLANFSKATELKNRIWFTIGALIVFRFLSFVPLPGINASALTQLADQTRGGVLDMFNMFTGGSLERMSLIALGVMPYITASIVVQMASALHPTLAAMKKEGTVGRQKLNQYTRYGTVFLCTIQGWFLASGLESYGAGESCGAGGAGRAASSPKMSEKISSADTSSATLTDTAASGVCEAACRCRSQRS